MLCSPRLEHTRAHKHTCKCMLFPLTCEAGTQQGCSVSTAHGIRDFVGKVSWHADDGLEAAKVAAEDGACRARVKV